jgi:hypothetical protein
VTWEAQERTDTGLALRCPSCTRTSIIDGPALWLHFTHLRCVHCYGIAPVPLDALETAIRPQDRPSVGWMTAFHGRRLVDRNEGNGT